MVHVTLHKAVLAGLLGTLLTGCASSEVLPQKTILDDDYNPKDGISLSESDKQRGITLEGKRAAARMRALQDEELKGAYAQGVRDTLQDFKGRMRARSQFVWEPPIVEMVEMPAANMNGAIYPRHVTPVIIAPGRWVEENGVRLPVE